MKSVGIWISLTTRWRPSYQEPPNNLKRKSATSQGQIHTSGGMPIDFLPTGTHLAYHEDIILISSQENSISTVVQIGTMQEKQQQATCQGGFVWSGKLWRKHNSWLPLSVHAKRISLRLEDARKNQERYKVSIFHHASQSLLLLFTPGKPSRPGCNEFNTFLDAGTLLHEYNFCGAALNWHHQTRWIRGGGSGVLYVTHPFLVESSIYNYYKVTPTLYVLHQNRESSCRTIELHLQPYSRIQSFPRHPLQMRLANRCLARLTG